MTLRHLRIFITVCRTLTMTAAAEQLYISQSAVSQAIAELEQFYHIKLFERLGKKLYVTASGQKLLEQAKRLVAMEEQTEEMMRREECASHLRIGASVVIGSYLLPQLMKTFHQKCPKTTFDICENNTGTIERAVLSNELDFGLVCSHVIPGEFIRKPFFQDRLLFVCGRNHRLAGKQSIDLKMLEKENFILREPRSGMRETFELFMSRSGVKWQSNWTCNNTESVKTAVADGLGISLLSECAVQDELRAGTLVNLRMNDVHVSRTCYLIYHKNKYINPAMQAFFYDTLLTADNDAGCVV